METCPSDHFINSTVCEQCSPVCLTCIGPLASNCTECAAGLFVYNGECVANCPTNYRLVGGTTCELNCASECASCVEADLNACTSCTTLNLSGSLCIA